MRLYCAGPPSVICIASGTRPGSYVGGGDVEHAWYADRLGSAGFKSELYAATAWSEASGYEPKRSRLLSGWYSCLGGLARLGISPRAVDYAVRGRRRRGDLIRRLRQQRGLNASPALTADPHSWRDAEVAACCDADVPSSISFASGGDGTRFCSHGWSKPESWGTWSMASRATMATRPRADGSVTVRLMMIAHVDASHPSQRLIIESGGRSRVETLHGPGPHSVEITLDGGRTNWLTLAFPDRWAPGSTDSRELAVGLVSAEVVPACESSATLNAHDGEPNITHGRS
jgi:hypothetical protein